MNALFRSLRITLWPIWLKLLTAFILAVMIPTLFVLRVIEGEVRAVDLENLNAYVSEKGHQRQHQIEEVFVHARDEITSFINIFAYRDLLIRLFSGSQATPVYAGLENYLEENLIASGLFSQVRILSTEGLVLFSSNILTSDGPQPAAPLHSDQSHTPAYQTALIAVELRADQRMVVFNEGGRLVVELVHVLYRLDAPMGFIVSTMDYTTAISSLLHDENPFIETYTYLASESRDVITPLNNPDQARASVSSSPVSAALSQRSGTEIYRVGDQNLIGHYAPIADTPFAVITEAPADRSVTLTLLNVYNHAGGVILGMFLLGIVLATAVHLSITPPLTSLREDIRALDYGDFDRPVSGIERSDVVGALARTFANTREQLASILDALQARVAARDRDIEATQIISRFAATQRDLDTLMNKVVVLITDLFPNIYHAQIFLLDADEVYAVLRASTGEAGQQLLSRGHRLQVGSVSVIGQVTEEGRVVVARDTTASDIHRHNEFLRETRAELAIPLRIGERIIGALDVQSKQNDAFTEDQINILQTMADQITIAIENARLYEESVRQLKELAASNQQATFQTWKEHLNYRRQRALVMEAGVETDTDLSPLRQMAIAQNEPIVGALTERNTIPFAVPIQLRGQVLGAAEWELPRIDFSDDKVQLAQELVNRLAVSLDNARLFQESRRAVERERLVNEIASKLTTQTDIDQILQTAVREVGQALRVPQVSVQLNWSKTEEISQSPESSTSHSKNGSQT